MSWPLAIVHPAFVHWLQASFQVQLFTSVLLAADHTGSQGYTLQYSFLKKG